MITSSNKSKRAGYTLIELMISVGLFALVMTLAAGAYLVIIGINRQAQGLTSGIDNLSFALETMTRTIRTNTNYDCSSINDCPNGANRFSVNDAAGNTITYAIGTGNNANTIIQSTLTTDGQTAIVSLTDSSTIKITSLTFYAVGTPPNDQMQARVTIVISGQVTSGVDKTKFVPFTVETGATMRGSDI